MNKTKTLAIGAVSVIAGAAAGFVASKVYDKVTCCHCDCCDGDCACEQCGEPEDCADAPADATDGRGSEALFTPTPVQPD